jgi:hypothetical protein
VTCVDFFKSLDRSTSIGARGSSAPWVIETRFIVARSMTSKIVSSSKGKVVGCRRRGDPQCKMEEGSN